MNIRVHIERLVLEGVPLTGAEGSLVETAVVDELSRLLADGGLAPGLLRDAAITKVPAGPVRLRAGGDPKNFGRQIGRSVYRGIGRNEKTGDETT